MPNLALKGGRPTRTKPFTPWPVFDEREEKALLEVLRSGVWGIGGRRNEEFSAKFAALHGARYGVTCTSGTTALEIALKAVGVSFGAEVIVPAYTFIATASAPLYLNAVPVFVDIEPETYCIDPVAVEKAIGPRTKAVIPVHIGGCPCNMDEVTRIVGEHGLYVVEDCAQAHGAEWRGRRVGGIGHMGCFSFQSSKNLNSGEGGMVISNDETLAERAWSLMNVGRARRGAWYEHPILGWNYRLTEFQAAILLAQMERLEEQMKRREENAAHLSRMLRQVGGVEPQRPHEGVTRHAYHLYIFRYRREEFRSLPRSRFIEALRAEGIPASPGYEPLHRAPAITGYRVPGLHTDYSGVSLPVTERACGEEGVWLTQNVLLGTRGDMEDIASAIRKIGDNVSELL